VRICVDPVADLCQLVQQMQLVEDHFDLEATLRRLGHRSPFAPPLEGVSGSEVAFDVAKRCGWRRDGLYHLTRALASSTRPLLAIRRLRALGAACLRPGESAALSLALLSISYVLAAQLLRPGHRVNYFSRSNGQWLEGLVLFNNRGVITLASLDGQLMKNGAEITCISIPTELEEELGPLGCDDGTIKPGVDVVYWSTTYGRQIPATVLRMRPGGCVDLNVKKKVPVAELEIQPPRSSVHGFLQTSAEALAIECLAA